MSKMVNFENYGHRRGPYLGELVAVHADVLAHPTDPDQPGRPDLPLGEGRTKLPLDGPPHRRGLGVQLFRVGEQLVVDDLLLWPVAELLGPGMVNNNRLMIRVTNHDEGRKQTGILHWENKG